MIDDGVMIEAGSVEQFFAGPIEESTRSFLSTIQ
jgi:hypothetical protein